MLEQVSPQHILSYLNKRAVGPPWVLNAIPPRRFSGAVVIPALAEAVNLPQTLESLSQNPPDLLERFLILVVINQRSDASVADTTDNLEMLNTLPLWKELYKLHNLFWVDAASAGKKLPYKQGVGLARKIGLDLALLHLDYSAGDPILVCLDADTLVQTDYLPSIISHFADTSAGGASIPYRHQLATDSLGQAAIDRYELFLRVYVLGLKLAGSPYAFHTVGSAMACRASAYTAAGGMNRRQAGEDFYFLQQVHKTSVVEQLQGTVVYPSPRASHRVPFGTGRSVGDMCSEGEQRLLFYQPAVFIIVEEWLAYVAQQSKADAPEILSGAAGISPVLHDFLKQSDFVDVWRNLKINSKDRAKLLAAFHGWFDAFRTMRLIHELSSAAFPRIAPEKAVAPLLIRTGVTVPGTVAEQLELLRNMQGAP
ncbi:MAG: glycosyltransferase family 2 protein [Desulfuromonadaceae bacterium]|nr:glycosyltransferase family 2 protein [Desulfuromonadaceae bacterium]MDD5105489.1 glycosyltransferase family 2 protein [Desulfuromonadaceae bacterium]